MDEFTYYNPVQVYFGKKQLAKLPDVLDRYGNRVLLVYGGGSIKKSGLYDKVLQLIDDFTVFEINGIQPNPDIESVRKGAHICIQNSIDVLLAVGGGSVIDAAKWIAAAAYVDFDPWDFFCRKTTIENALPLVTVLTAAAAGSEMNSGGVISNRDAVKKVGRGSPLLFPKASFLVPEITYSVGSYQTACGAVDILSHVMEVYFHKQKSMEMLDSIMESLMRTVIKYGPVAFQEPENYAARANLMWAASWAMNGLINGTIRQGWNCHTIEHELSARYSITHGHGLAILIPRWLRYCYCNSRKEKYCSFAINVLQISDDTRDEKLPDEMIRKIEQLFFDTFQLQSNLRTFGINKDELKEISERLCIKGPVQGFADLDAEDIYKILLSCY